MDFATATRIFNRDQSNAGSFIPGTGDAGQQHGEIKKGRKGKKGQNLYQSSLGEPLNAHEEETEEGDRNFHHEPFNSSGGQYNDDGTEYDSKAATFAGLNGSRGLAGKGAKQPFDVANGPSAVVPGMMPSRKQVDANPHRMITIRNPHRKNIINLATEENYENHWFRVRSYMRVYFAEFLGTMILVLWGEGTQAQVIAARNAPNDYLSIAWGWGVGFMLAIYVSSGISGGHINPAVTISLAVFRKFPWRKVPGYIVAQVLGALAAAAIIFGVYYGPLNELQDGYAAVLTTGPAGALPSIASTFFSVFSGAALLMGAIAAFTDTGNNPATPGLTPLLLGLIMVGIASSFGYQTGFVLNPARDLGPRLLVWATGISGRQLWLDNAGYGLWVPTAGSVTGALFGNLLYDLLIYNGRDSPTNFNFHRNKSKAEYKNETRRQRKERKRRERGEKEKSAVGVTGAKTTNNDVDLEKGQTTNSDTTLNGNNTSADGTNNKDGVAGVV